MTTTTKFSDSQQQEAWRAYACAATKGMIGHWLFGIFWMILGGKRQAAGVADEMMAEEMKRSRG